MLIGIDGSRANKKERTGVEWYSYFLIQEFKKIIPPDIQVVLYSPTPFCDDLLPLPPNWQIKILRWPFRFWTIFRLSWEMLLHKPDIFFSPANIIPFFAPEKSFTTIHDIGFKQFSKCYSRTERWLQNFGVCRALKISNTIFVPSEFTKKELIEVFAAPSEKIVATPLGYKTITLTTVRVMVDEVLEKYKIKKPYFLFIGRKEEKKNISGIIRAFKIFSEKNPGFSLILAGLNGYGWNEIAASPFGLLAMTERMIVLLNWISTEEKQILLQNAEVFIFPSLYEGFGLPILEAMALGTPVITSNTASMPEVADDAALLTDPKNPQKIAEAMERITKNTALKTELVKKGLERVKNFSWEKCAKITLNTILAS